MLGAIFADFAFHLESRPIHFCHLLPPAICSTHSNTCIVFCQVRLQFTALYGISLLMKKRDTKEALLDAADHFFQLGQTPSVREIASKAGVAAGMLTHHFQGYARLVAGLTGRLIDLEADELGKLDVPKGRSQLETALAFFRALAGLDLDPKHRRLRKAAGKSSWEWDATDESALAASYMNLLEPLRKQLKLEKGLQSDDILKTLWAIYQQPLRLALIDALLKPSNPKTPENLVAEIEADIRPKFALILKLK